MQDGIKMSNVRDDHSGNRVSFSQLFDPVLPEVYKNDEEVATMSAIPPSVIFMKLCG